MNYFKLVHYELQNEEVFVIQKKNLKIYDQSKKTDQEVGDLILTSHNIYFGESGAFSGQQRVKKLSLKDVESIEEEMGSHNLFSTKRRTVLRILDKENNWEFIIKITGPNGIDSELGIALEETFSAKLWKLNDNEVNDLNSRRPYRTGIGGIQKNLQEKQQKTDETIGVAFRDLSRLIEMAKEMVNVSKSISLKIQQREINADQDETMKFKTCLMSLGIEDPVLKDNFQNRNEFYEKLSNEITQLILEPLIESGGMMTIIEVYCRINRARGLALVSPEDVYNACQLMNGPVKLRQYSSGSLILQLENHSDSTIAEEVASLIKAKTFLTIEDFAKDTNISIFLARERLLIAEQIGKVCRDESVEGLRYYSNLFV